MGLTAHRRQGYDAGMGQVSPSPSSPNLLSRPMVVRCAHGLHLRIAAKIVTLTNQFESAIWLSSHTRSANAKSILAMLELGLSKGTPFTVTVNGPDAEQALAALAALIGEPALCGEAHPA